LLHLPFKAYWLRVPTGLKLQNWHSAHIVFICFVFISEQTATSAQYNTNWLVFITRIKSVFCTVPTGSLNQAICASSLKCWNCALADYTFLFCIQLSCYVLLCAMPQFSKILSHILLLIKCNKLRTQGRRYKQRNK